MGCRKSAIKSRDMFFLSWTYINFTWLSKHAALLGETWVQRDRCPSRKCDNMRSVWTAWFQFWGIQHLLCIDVLFFCNILNEQRRIQWVQLDRLKKKKSIKMQRHLHRHHILCATYKAAWSTSKIRMQHFCIRMCIFILNSTNIRNSNFFWQP